MVLVVGATGSLGRRIVHKLRAQGEDVRVLVRPASDWAELERAGAEIALGDLKEPPSLDRACAGVEVVVTTANSAKRGGADNVETVDLTGNRNLIDAAARAGVRRFVFVSVLGVSADSPVPGSSRNGPVGVREPLPVELGASIRIGAGTSPRPAGGEVTAIIATTARPTEPAPTRTPAARRRVERRSISSTAAHASTSYRAPISPAGAVTGAGATPRPARRCLTQPSRSTRRRQPGHPKTCFQARSSSAAES